MGGGYASCATRAADDDDIPDGWEGRGGQAGGFTE